MCHVLQLLSCLMLYFMLSTRKWSLASLLCAGTDANTHYVSTISLASWVPPGCFLGASRVLPGCQGARDSSKYTAWGLTPG